MKFTAATFGLVMALGSNAYGNGFVWTLGANPMEGTIWRVGIPAASFAQTASTQQESEWCWAASISNIFAYYGHVVNQSDIVDAIKGYFVNQGATPGQIASAVNRQWTDQAGNTFTATLTAAYDPMDGIRDMTNMYIVDQLKQGKPLLVCNTHHCMDITAADFSNFSIDRIWVFDPWPGYGVHQLPPIETIIMDQVVMIGGTPVQGRCTFVGAVDVN